MVKPFRHEQSVTVDGETLRLVINFGALDAVESLLDRSFNDVLKEFAARDPKLGLVGSVLWGLLREHHHEMTLDQCATLMFGETGTTIGLAINELLTAAFPAAEPEAKGKNPRKPRGASKSS